jgi:hypothetical protein
MTDTNNFVQVPEGQGNRPDLPYIDLPRTEALPRAAPKMRVTVGPDPKNVIQDNVDGVWGSLPVQEYKGKEKPETKTESADGIWGAEPEYTPERAKEIRENPEHNHREIGAGEAFARSATTSATFGLEPAIEGARAAGQTPEARGESEEDYIRKVARDPVGALGGEIGNVVHGLYKIFTDSKAKKIYDEEREKAQKDLEAGGEQHPIASTAGTVAGALALPLPGMAPAAAGARIARGAALGGAGGALYGAGAGVSKGEGAGDIAKDAAVGGGLGVGLGGAIGGVLGSRAKSPVASPGERAAQTAHDLGAPIPRGLASDNPAVNNATASARSIPIVGSRIGSAVDATQHAAGEHIGDIAGRMTGGATDRAAADATIRPGLERVIENNRDHANSLYDTLRSMIDQNARFRMGRTRAALDDIMKRRAAAGWTNPGQGLEQFENVANGATFNGAHRARVDAREAGNPLVPHPGYNAADYNRLVRAMTEDLRGMVAQSALGNRTASGAHFWPSHAQRSAAVQAFDRAETAFGPIAEQNAALQRLVDARGEGAIATLLGAAKAKSGDLSTLAQLRQAVRDGRMSQADFDQVGGTLLAELGHSNATGEFSLGRFVTNWDKVSDRAKSVLFSPQHLRDINDIFNLGTHIKRSLRETNSSHTANVLIWFDLARDAIVLGASGMAGTMGPGVIGGAAMATPGLALMHWLSRPASASAMAKWARARAGMAQPTPARIAVFNLATRNLSNNLGVPVETIMKRLAAPVAASEGDDQQPKGVGERGR